MHSYFYLMHKQTCAGREYNVEILMSTFDSLTLYNATYIIMTKTFKKYHPNKSVWQPKKKKIN